MSSSRRKRQKLSYVEDLICPISRELPIDPVMAEDSRVYEREEIEAYFKTANGDQIKSPVAGTMMGKRLLPAIQQRNTIERMIENKDIVGSPAEEWKQKLKNQEVFKKANQGDMEAMVAIFENYMNGRNGFKADDEMSYKWSKKLHDAGSVLGTTFLGIFLVFGQGVTPNYQQGTVYLGIAAAKGSNGAAFTLGKALAKGLYGLDVDHAEAKRQLEFSLSENCAYDTMSMLFSTKEERNSFREKTKKFLGELQ